MSGPSLPAFLAPPPGRDGELTAIIGRCVQLVTQRCGGLVMVEGEAGMGKSRLVEELQHRCGVQTQMLGGLCVA